MRRILLAAAILVALPVAIPSPAGAVRPTSGFAFDEQRLFDSRPGGIQSGVEVAAALPGDIVNVLLINATDDTFVYVHPCGVAPDRTQPAANWAPAGDTTSNLVPVRAGEGCMTLFGAADLVVDRVGREAQVGGANYVAHPDPVDLSVAPSVGGVFTVPADDALVPADADLVAVWVTVEGPPDTLSLISQADCATGTPTLTTQTVSAPPGHTHGNLMLLPLDASGQICFRQFNAAPASLTVSRWGYLADGATATAEGLPYSGFVEQRLPGFTALTPSRRFDTRDGGGPQLGAGTTFRHRFDDLPADATAVALNLTVTETGGAGFVTAYPCDGDRPEASSLNHTAAGQTIANFAIVPLGPTREVCFFTLAPTHLIADLSGYFGWDLGHGYTPREPSRVFDTRNGGVPIAPGGTYVADLSGFGPMSAAVLNVTVTEPAAAGFVTVHPCDVPAPLVSNLNYLPGQTRPNLATVRVPSDGRVCFSSSAQTHLVVDLAGGYTATSDIGFLTSEQPFRVFDTRADGQGPLAGGNEYWYDLANIRIDALAWNLTATEPSGPGFVTMYPCEIPTPTTSNVNYSAAGETVANFSVIQPSDLGLVCMWSLATTHLIADEAGYYAGPIGIEVYYEGAPTEPDFSAAARAGVTH